MLGTQTIDEEIDVCSPLQPNLLMHVCVCVCGGADKPLQMIEVSEYTDLPGPHGFFISGENLMVKKWLCIQMRSREGRVGTGKHHLQANGLVWMDTYCSLENLSSVRSHSSC